MVMMVMFAVLALWAVDVVARRSHAAGRVGIFGRHRAELHIGAALVTQRCTAPAAHVSVTTEIGDFKGRHLHCNLPEMGSSENERPRELQCRPDCNCDEERVVACSAAPRLGDAAHRPGHVLWRHVLRRVLKNVPDSQVVEEHHARDEEQDKEHEPAVIPKADTVPDPWAVMVEPADAALAQSAVLGT